MNDMHRAMLRSCYHEQKLISLNLIFARQTKINIIFFILHTKFITKFKTNIY